MAQNGLTFIKRQRTLCLNIKSAGIGKTSLEEWMEFNNSHMKVERTFINNRTHQRPQEGKHGNIIMQLI